MMEPSNFKIPTLGWPANAGSYHETPFAGADPRAAEPLVKLSAYGIAGESYYARTDGANTPYGRRIDGALNDVWARKTVAEKLVRVNEALAPRGVELFVLDAYRTIECQMSLWGFFWERAVKERPDMSEIERRDYVLNFVSCPIDFAPGDSSTWPVHATGGAVDLTLRDKATGQMLPMGIGFDEMSKLDFSDAFERKLVAHEIAPDDPRLVNRRTLHAAMTEEGFVNYPLEFWHFDYGDQMYVFHKHLLGHRDAPQAAWYGAMPSPEAA